MGSGISGFKELHEIWNNRSHSVMGYEEAESYETRGLMSGRDKV